MRRLNTAFDGFVLLMLSLLFMGQTACSQLSLAFGVASATALAFAAMDTTPLLIAYRIRDNFTALLGRFLF